MQPQSRLLNLPVELRLCIYEFVFLPIQFYSARIPDNFNEKASRALLPLLTCYQIYEEARLIAFSRTTFHVTNTATSLRDRLSSQLLGAVRYLAITFNLSPELRVFDFLGSSFLDMGLEQLSFIIRDTSDSRSIDTWILSFRAKEDGEGAVRHVYTQLPNFDLSARREMSLLIPLCDILNMVPVKRNSFDVDLINEDVLH